MLEERFGDAAHGVHWAFSRIRGAVEDETGLQVGKRKLVFKTPPKDQGDSFAVRVTQNALTIQASTAVGAIGALNECARQTERGRLRDVKQRLRFQTRFYKLEASFIGMGKRRGNILYDLSPEILNAFFQQIVSRHFNALVLYAGYHPFEHFLDYKGLSWGTYKKETERRKNFEGMQRILKIAQQYGLRTYLHHYVGHFTQRCADHAKLGIKEGGTRLASYDHPITDKYQQYIYKRTFETLPDLDGLFLNFESAGDGMPIVERTLLPIVNGMMRKPSLYLRLWGVHDVDAVVRLLGKFKCRTGLIHKSHERNDVYYYPECDERVKLWKEALPDTEFGFSIGPCHNCGTNIGSKLWTDPDYMHRLLDNIEKKGADSISFQSSFDLTMPLLPGGEAVTNEHMVSHARMNQGHKEAVVDAVRGLKPTYREWARRYADWFGVSVAAGDAIRKAILSSSQIALKMYWQFLHGSAQEGYLYPARYSYYQEPFFYQPMSMWGTIGTKHFGMKWSKNPDVNKPVNVLPSDTQAIIDFVNPTVKKRPANHPMAIVRQLKGHVRDARDALAAYRKAAGKKVDPTFVNRLELNILNGERISREILIGIELYSCFFARNKPAFYKHVKAAQGLMRECVKVLGDRLKETNDFLATSVNGKFRPAEDAEELQEIVRWERRSDFPFEALAAYMRSHERYNEIRRLCRPNTPVQGEVVERNRRLLRQALSAAEISAAILTRPTQALFRDNVMAWIEYLRAELDWLTPPAMACRPDERAGPTEGFRMMVHDQCYRWGENCWVAFRSFFRRENFFREDVCDCRATRTKRGLKVSLREHGIDWKQRKEVWDKNRGTVNQNGFLQVFLDTGNQDEGQYQYTIYFRGEGGVVTYRKRLPDGRVIRTKPAPIRECATHFEHTDSNWRFDIVIPWKQLGGMPKTGDVWGINMLTNPAVLINRRVVFSQAYELRGGFDQLGRLVFTH